MEIYPIYAGGEFVTTNHKLNVINSFDGEIFAQTYLADAFVLEKAILAAENALPIMKALPSCEKYTILMEIASEMKCNENHLAELLAMEACKPIKYALAEIGRAVQTIIVAAEESKRLQGEYMSIDWTAAGKGKEGWVKYFPVGLVAGIAPFNFPINLAVHKIAPAIASRCSIILKPASSTPLSTLEFAKIVDKTSLPKGALSILPMDRNAGNQLVTDERFKLLTFTGSPEVGWKMKNDAGKKKVVLELGGNAGVIITKTANIDVAVAKCVVGGFAYSGQVCIHAQRMYVHIDIFEEFTQKFTEAVKLLKQGNPLDMQTDISAMIDENNAIRVEEWVSEAVNSGAKIICGGNRNGAFYPPTVLTDTHKDMKVCALEVFGPVVTLEPYHNFNDAVEFVNDSRFGLQAGVFTNEISEMNQAFSLLEVGGVIINDVPTFRVDHAPYGGIKDSGLGREGVKYAIQDMMEAKILIKPM
ncbi:MAG: aldehyde dehydrogenase family protein [Bacteroidetes bacterium]|nr:aldehyde dehydrogenase family protein [Bacteroidota bacterium]